MGFSIMFQCESHQVLLSKTIDDLKKNIVFFLYMYT